MNKDKVVLDLCGGTGAWSRPYLEAGYTVYNITLPKYDITMTDIRDDIIAFKGPEDTLIISTNKIHGILAAPPCTQFSFARQRYKVPPDFRGAMQTVKACLDIIWAVRWHSGSKLEWWAMENPTGHLRKFLGRPPWKFYQWQFGGIHVKSTDIWGWYNTPVATVRKKPKVDHAVIDARWSNPPIPDFLKEQLKTTKERRAAVRAITPEGFARAFFKQNP